MSSVARILLVPFGLLVAVVAFAHAASENDALPFGPGFFGRSGIDAQASATLVDRSFRAEIMTAEARALAAARGQEFSPEDLVALASDPAAQERFMAARQSSFAGESMARFPRISNDLFVLALRTYVSDPLNVPVLRTIALGHVAHEDLDEARRLTQLAGRLSKRDEITNLWLAEDYGRRGDVRAMLASFDKALRTSGQARRAAIRPFVALIATEKSHAQLGAMLKRRPEWEEDFWHEFAINPAALARVEAFIENSDVSLDQMPSRARQTLYMNLKRDGHLDALYELAELDPATQVTTEAIRQGKFISSGDGNPLGWTFRSRGNYAASAQNSGQELQIDAQAGSAGVGADRVVQGGGDYRMALKMIERVPANSRVKLAAICLGEESRELARIALKSDEMSGDVMVAAQDCRFLNLELSFEAAEGRRSPLIRVAQVEFQPR